VDILFLLIIFFTVTTTFANTGGIDVNLPQASSQLEIEKVDKLYVVIDQGGQAYIKGEKKSAAELQSAFKGLIKNNPDALLVVEADKNTNHGRVVEIMDMAQAAGLKRLAIATEQTPLPKADKGDEKETDEDKEIKPDK
jgi:biopolymer transport protein ExbD